MASTLAETCPALVGDATWYAFTVSQYMYELTPSYSTYVEYAGSDLENAYFEFNYINVYSSSTSGSSSSSSTASVSGSATGTVTAGVGATSSVDGTSGAKNGAVSVGGGYTALAVLVSAVAGALAVGMFV